MIDAAQIVSDATKLKADRYKQRDLQLLEREAYRFRRMAPEVPAPYNDVATVYQSPVIQEEGRQVVAILEAKPQPHVIPPTPTDQPKTTLMEDWLSAGDIELEAVYGNPMDKAYSAQVHARIGWIYEAPKRVKYSGAPKAPPEDADEMAQMEFTDALTAYKQEEGIGGFIERRFVPTGTAYVVGNEEDPLRFYEIKKVDELELIATYNLSVNRDGTYSKPPSDTSTLPSGRPTAMDRPPRKEIEVIEYWDREDMAIVIKNTPSGWAPNRQQFLVLEQWSHDFGRVPYFSCPAFQNETIEEDTKFEGPLDGIYAEVPYHNELMTMKHNVTYLRSYPSWQIVTKETGEQILDDNGDPKVYIKFYPGQIFQTGRGQEVLPIPMQAGNDLLQEVLASEARLKQFTLSDVSQGVAPGADTANAAISQLQRLQRSSLQRMAKNRAQMYREIYKFRLKNLKEYGETVYVYSDESGDMVGLSAEDVVTLNVQVKYEPDTGQDALIEEKQAADLEVAGLITEQEFHERRGKENPEQYVVAGIIERARKMLEPTLLQQVLASLGDAQAIQQLIQAGQQTGDARNGVAGVMEQIQSRQNGNSGMGTGSPDMPRTMGVRETVAPQTTRPDLGSGF